MQIRAILSLLQHATLVQVALHETVKKLNLLTYDPGNRNHIGFCPLPNIFPKTCLLPEADISGESGV